MMFFQHPTRVHGFEEPVFFSVFVFIAPVLVCAEIICPQLPFFTLIDFIDQVIVGQ
jgi:hypothetical protein